MFEKFETVKKDITSSLENKITKIIFSCWTEMLRIFLFHQLYERIYCLRCHYPEAKIASCAFSVWEAHN